MLLLPETSLASSHCLEDDYAFSAHCKKVFKIIGETLERFDEDKKNDSSQFSVYFNNVIGILGGRGSGKTSIVHSIFATIKNSTAENDYFNSGSVVPIEKPIDPKCVPAYLGVLDCVLGSLYSFLSSFKGIDDASKSKLRNKFNDVGFHVSNLTMDKRRDVIDNPSDLYDVMQVLNIRNMLGELIGSLLETINANLDSSLTQRKAFLLCIDDFDLDSSRCRQMAMEIPTFLTIPGLIVLLTMDPEIFDAEIERSRISELSNLGEASSAYLNSQSNISRRRTNYEVISEAAMRYKEQLSDKLIPFSMRVLITPTDVAPRYVNVKRRILDLLFTLTGIDFSRTDLHPFFSSMYRKFRDEFYLFDDARTRNQIINQLLIISDSKYSNGELREKCGDMADLFFRLVNAGSDGSKNSDSPKDYIFERGDSFVDVLGNQLFLASRFSSLREIRDFLAADSHDFLGYDGHHPIFMTRLYSGFFEEHPLAYLMYESFANNLIPDDDDFIDEFVNRLNSFGNGDQKMCALSDNPTADEPGIIIYGSQGESWIASSVLEDAFRRVDLAAVTSSIDRYIRSTGREASLKNLMELASWIKEYMGQVDTPNATRSSLYSLMSRLDDVISNTWRTANDRAARKVEANAILRRIKLALRNDNDARKNRSNS